MAHTADPPSLAEIIQLTRTSLSEVEDEDEIRECGRPALSILQSNPDMCLQFAYQKLHDVPYREVKTCWRRLYTDAALWKVSGILERREKGDREERGEMKKEEDYGESEKGGDGDWVTEVVRTLDMALILTGVPRREELVELVFSSLHGLLAEEELQEEAGDSFSQSDRPQKRRKLGTPEKVSSKPSSEVRIPETFPTTIPYELRLRFPILRISNLSLEDFQVRISTPKTQTPLIIENAIDFWPALSARPWSKPSYLLSHTLNGRRLVPVEIGRSYTDHSWGQKILSFGDFMREFMFQEAEDSSEAGKNAKTTGYLAQHDLFAQIPSLRSDIAIPDYCYADPPNHPASPASSTTKPVQRLDTPLLNAWFGPANTISPAHTDPYHNILAQVVGYKYIRLYAPSETEKLYPMGVDEKGVDMGNTSSLDLDQAMDLFPDISPWRNDMDGIGGIERDGRKIRDEQMEEERRRVFEENFPMFKEAKYVEGILGPGDCLYIPVGWWHYVRSLTPSFSVSFWFN